MPKVDFSCLVSDCNTMATTEYCEMHRARMRTYGSPTPRIPCWECKQDFVLEGAGFKPHGGKTTGARGHTCPSCAATLLRLKDHWPAHFGKVNLHGISVVDYVLLLESQEFSCALCCEPFTSKRQRHIDHDHKCCPGNWGCPKCIRGIVCPGCNTLVGYLENKTRLIDKFYEQYTSGRPFGQLGGDANACTT